MDQFRMNRLWLFFAVIAVGLVWTWSQVGQRQMDSSHVEGGDIVLLHTEAGCNLAMGPCAAYLNDFAVVASARASGEGVAWRVRLVGEGGPALPQLSLRLLLPGGAAQELAVLEAGDEWQADSAQRVAPGSILRVRISGDPMPLIADFPLRERR